MSADVIPIQDFQAEFERNRTAYRLKLAGVSTLRIAEELKCTVEEVERGVARLTGAVTPAMRTAAVKIELDRYDEMHRAIWAQATAGSLEHMAMALRISDMRNKVLGLYAPPSSNDALRNAMVAGHQSSTERIRAALQLVISQRTIDGSATEMKDVSETKDDGPTPPRDTRGT